MATKYQLKEGFKYRILEGEAVLLDLDSGDHFSLNPTGTTVFEELLAGKTEPEIASTLRKKFNPVPEEKQVQADISHIIGELKTNGILLEV